jgi:hypothetical protein
MKDGEKQRTDIKMANYWLPASMLNEFLLLRIRFWEKWGFPFAGSCPRFPLPKALRSKQNKLPLQTSHQQGICSKIQQLLKIL